MRRQNRSCDQCRKAKKACDADPTVVRRGSTAEFADAGDWSLDGSGIGVGGRSQSCSYCTKTKKRCTFRWLQSQLQARGSDAGSVPGSDRRRSARDRQARQTHTLPRRPLVAEQRDLNAPPLSSVPEVSPHGLPPSWDPLVPDFEVPVLPDASWQNTFPQGPGLDAGGLRPAFAGESFDGVTGEPTNPPDKDAGNNTYPTSQYSTSDNGLIDPFHQDWNFGYSSSRTLGSGYPSQSSSAPSNDLIPFKPRQQSFFSQTSFAPTPSLSLFSAEQSMMDRSNNTAISSNLLRIYHDVVEYSLACWLTENTCPYKIRPYHLRASPGLLQAPGQTPPEDATKSASQKRSSWANRIYSRVIKLDKVAQSTRLIQLTKAEDRAAAKALRLSIMAFATQWAQKSHRAEEQYDQSDDEEDLDAGITEEFDRTIQRSLWEQAFRALQKCVNLETFRVVCAEVIFSWIQKPWDEDDIPADPGGSGGDAGSIRQSLSSELENIISKDGLPVFLERSARKARALKFKIDAHDAGLDVTGGGADGQGPRDDNFLDDEDRDTAGLLYWLTVMADTISSSMHERPVVLSDEDSQRDDLKAPTPSLQAEGKLQRSRTQRWGLDMFVRNNPLQYLRWPCSHDDAARAVQESVAIKVLIWRYVSYLQNSLRAGQPVEELIHGAMAVYRYWNTTYGVFFRDLVENYDAVPPHVRGWFVCIHAHWHLGSLMLADLVEFVDGRGLGIWGASQERVRTKLVEGIRSRSADEMAELSRVSTPATADGTGDSPAPQMPEFHFAINAGSILTEPWTMLLIRAYSKAYVIHFGKAEELWRRDKEVDGRKSEACGESLRRCEDCIRALWFLGKKSDISRGVAKALSRALKALEDCIAKEAVQLPYGTNAVEEMLPVQVW